jgi:acetyl esterase/lipase
MRASWALLALAAWSAPWTVVSYRPPRRPAWLMMVAFFAAWSTTELAAVHVVWQVALTLALVAAGALAQWPGWVGLALMAASASALVASTVAAHRTDRVFAKAFADAFGDRWRDALGADAPGDGIEWRRVALPFRFRRRGVERVRDVPYADGGSRRHRLDVYRPSRPEGGAPVLLQIHGGGWMVGRKEQQGLPLVHHLAARGWVCVAVNYRLSPRATWPDQIVDCKRALAWIRQHVAEHGGDPDYVVVTGGSAGGHLAALVALTAGDPRWQPGFEDVDTSVRAFVPFYGVYDWTNRLGLRHRRRDLGFVLERYVVKRPLAEAPHVYDAASPMSRVHAGAPPALVVHGRLDRLAPVEEARAFVARLREVSSRPVAYAELPGTHHAFDVFLSIRTLHTVAAVDAFLTWLLRSDPPGTGAAPSRAAAPVSST